MSAGAAGDPPVLLVGSGNPHKLEEIREILADLDLQVLGADALPAPPVIEERGATFEENARAKALAFAAAAVELRERPAVALGDRTLWVVADDSGLCVDALGGRPGVHSARYAAGAAGAATGDAGGNTGGNADSAANNRKLLAELEGVPEERRTARFVCAVAVAEVAPRPQEAPRLLFSARGECPGRIIRGARGSGGFGYDPLFLVPELGRTFAELPPREKHRMSHRGRAFRALRRELEKVVRAAPPAGGARS
jgi:XTP/dITP diphosphohydrolase